MLRLAWRTIPSGRQHHWVAIYDKCSFLSYGGCFPSKYLCDILSLCRTRLPCFAKLFDKVWSFHGTDSLSNKWVYEKTLASNNPGIFSAKKYSSFPRSSDSASNALSASRYNDTTSMAVEYFKSSAIAAWRSWYESVKRTSGLLLVERM